MWKTLFTRLLGCPVEHPRRFAMLPGDDGVLLEVDPADELPRGCGWFDSSHELRAGLVLTVHTPDDAEAAALPLAEWLALQLAGCRRLEPCA